jgi:hypothetical protein
MSIILDENHIDPLQDPVQKALEAFVEAARQSDKPYTLDSLTEMVRGELLQEAGGVFSWLKRWISGTDTNLLDELKDDIAKIETEKDKQAVLSDIDKFLKQAKGLTGGQIAAFVVSNPFFWGSIALIVRLLKSKDGSTKDYIESMQKLRSEVVAIKVK